ncbi:hypothetical protein D3C87_1814730 [compost metagenome]
MAKAAAMATMKIIASRLSKAVQMATPASSDSASAATSTYGQDGRRRASKPCSRNSAVAGTSRAWPSGITAKASVVRAPKKAARASASGCSVGAAEIGRTCARY